jgi:hypothetical protein
VIRTALVTAILAVYTVILAQQAAYYVRWLHTAPAEQIALGPRP